MKICSPRRAASLPARRPIAIGLAPTLRNPRAVARHDEPHMGVLGTAIFGAGARVNAFVIGLYADEVGMVRNQIDLAVKCRNPKRMDHVERTQFDINRPANRNVDLVGGSKALRRSPKVFHFPPPLLANNCDRGMQVMMVIVDRKTRH